MQWVEIPAKKKKHIIFQKDLNNVQLIEVKTHSGANKEVCLPGEWPRNKSTVSATASHGNSPREQIHMYQIHMPLFTRQAEWS